MTTSLISCTIDGVENVSVPETELEKRDGMSENEAEIVRWVEYYLHGKLVHRSVHLHLKQGLGSQLEQAAF